ncbi:MAG: hypothetical protein OEZ34_14725 [Spirochaetia bacterium]|nr:hypothetical protein [Spirochaetia bacterium]
MKQNKKLTLLTAAFLIPVFISTVLSAEDLYMRNGQVLKGRVLGQNASSVEFRTDKGRQWISKTDIKRIVYQPKTDEQKKARLAALKKKREEQRLARLKIEQEQKAKEEKERLLKELE